MPPMIWNTEAQISYNLTFQSSKQLEESYLMFTAKTQRNQSVMEESDLTNLKENTTYVIRVSAINEFGSSPQSSPVLGTTKASTG